MCQRVATTLLLVKLSNEQQPIMLCLTFNRLKDMARKFAYVLWMVEFFVLYWELIDLYQEKTKNFEKYKIFNYNTIKYRGINYRILYNN